MTVIFRWLLAGSLCLFAHAAAAQSQPKYFGYWANNGQQPDNHAHTNITMIGTWTQDREEATAIILSELEQARLHHLRAIVDVRTFLFNVGPNGACPYTQNPDRGHHWNVLIERLVAYGYLVPDDPTSSTVAAFYPVDEPELCGLKDKSIDLAGLVIPYDHHPTLKNAIDIVRLHPYTVRMPLAVILSSAYDGPSRYFFFGMRLFDWIGVNDYSKDDDQYLAMIAKLKTRMRLPEQRVIMVPQAAVAVDQGLDPYPHTPQRMYQAARTDASVVLLMPFLWAHPFAQGTRDHPHLRAEYTRIGTEIRYGY